MTIPADQWDAAKAIFTAAVALEEPARSAYLVEACGTDLTLRQQLERLLLSHDEAAGFLETPAAALPLPSPVDEVIGRTIGAYRVESHLGSGGMGDVYKAHDTKLDRPVALKLLSPRFAADGERLRRFHAEGRAASSLNHPHILVIHDFGEVDGRPFIVTEFVEGQTLRQRLDVAPFTLRETAHIITQVGSALAAAHARGLVHRDIKPENVMLRPDGYVKVLDFGIAKLLAADEADASGSGTQIGEVIGTPRYMSPEQAGGRRVDARSDLFALGTVAYEMLSGRAPFTGDTAMHTLHAIMFDAPKPLTGSGAMTAIDRVLVKAMAKDPAERYQSAPAMVAEFRAASGMTDTEGVVPGSPGARTVRGRVRQWWPIAMGLIVLLVGMGSWRQWAPASPVVSSTAPPAPFPSPSDIASGKSRLAVLPFENLTRNAADDWLSGGLSDSLTFGLQSLNTLILTTRDRTVDVYRQHQVREAAALDPKVVRTLVEALGVQYYVHGNYQRVGDDIRVVARLVMIETGEVTAQESVTDRFANILKVEDELASRFAAKLDAAGHPARPSAGTESVDAYRVFSEAQTMYANAMDQQTTRQRLREAIRLDPRYAQAWALLSKTHSRASPPAGVAPSPTDDDSREAWRTAQRAVELDPLLYDAHVALALAHRRGFRIAEARTEAERAMALNPRVAEAYTVLATSYNESPSWSCARDRNAALAEEYYRTSIRLEPRSPLAYGALVDHFLWTREPARALTVADQGLKVLPDNDYLKGRRVYALLNMGRTDEARVAMQALPGGQMPVAADRLLSAFWLEAWSGTPGPAAQQLKDTASTGNSDAAVFQIRLAWIMTAANQAPAAIPHLESALRLDPSCRAYIATTPGFTALHNTSAFAAVLATAR